MVMYFLDHAFYEVVIKIFVYFLIMNPSWYENIVNLFEHDMETQILFKLIKQPSRIVLVFNGRH